MLEAIGAKNALLFASCAGFKNSPIGEGNQNG
jgi:hypothetical protein